MRRPSLVDPRRSASLEEQRYVFRANISTLSSEGEWVLHDTYRDYALKALYSADTGRDRGPQVLQDEAPASHEIRLLGWHGGIYSGNRVTLRWPEGTEDENGDLTTQDFKILSVVPDELALQTIMTVTPDQ